MASLPPGALLVLGALVVPLLRGKARSTWLLALPVASAVQLFLLRGMGDGGHLQVHVFDYTLELIRMDRLAFIFGLVFHAAALLCVLFSLHVEDRGQHVAGLAYAGAAIGGVFAGDLLTFFVWWEATSIASAFLVWASRTERSYGAGMRYLVLQVGSGVVLLAGILYHLAGGGSLAFDRMATGSVGTNLIFIAIGVKAAFPLLHMWLPDAYPEATPTGTVFLGAFTTKLAVYALARGFPGTDSLVWIGAAMTLFPIPFALLADDFRRLLSYSLIVQLGFMVTAIGIGTPLAIDGAAAHAAAHVLYKSLLFMAMGAVLYRTGTARASRLGGLGARMPYTAAFCAVGAASIAAAPPFCGFVSKSLILAAVAERHQTTVWLVLVFASACALQYVALRVPWFIFFGERKAGTGEVAEAPRHMLLAMGAAALLCLALGAYPRLLLDLLPNRAVYNAYTGAHVVGQLELLAFSALAFVLLMRVRLYPRPAAGVLRDADWLYRTALPAIGRPAFRAAAAAREAVLSALMGRLRALLDLVYRCCSPRGVIARTWALGATVLIITVLLAAFLILYYS